MEILTSAMRKIDVDFSTALLGILSVIISVVNPRRGYDVDIY